MTNCIVNLVSLLGVVYPMCHYLARRGHEGANYALVGVKYIRASRPGGVQSRHIFSYFHSHLEFLPFDNIVSVPTESFFALFAPGDIRF